MLIKLFAMCSQGTAYVPESDSSDDDDE